MKLLCRICFGGHSNMQDLAPFLPLIRTLAQTTIPHENGLNQICKSCCNGLIMASLFRVKVVESNAKYKELLASHRIDHDYYTPVFDEEDMKVEYLEESLNDKSVMDAIPVKKILLRKIKLKHKTPLKEVKSVVKRRFRTSLTPVIQKSKPTCFICTDLALIRNPLFPFMDTLDRVISVGDITETEYLCDSCTQKLKNAETFFIQMDKVQNRSFNKNCCQFCLSKDNELVNTSDGTFGIINSLPLSNHEYEVYYKGKTCLNCVQLLKRVKMLRDSYLTKEKLFKRKNMNEVTNEQILGTNVSSTTPDIFYESCKEEFQENLPPETTDTGVKVRLDSEYVKPDPDKPIPYDYQCHMSDFESDESDTDLPDVRFGRPLNKPFKPEYFSCAECTYKSVNVYELEAHIQVMHETTSSFCDACNKQLKDIGVTRQHKFTVHFSGFSSFSFKKFCEYCGKLESKMDDHLVKAHYGTRPYECNHCNYTAKTKSSLESHIYAIHLGEKRYKCQYCDKRFSYGADKSRHEIGSHTKQYRHICKFCGKCFLKKNFLTNHYKSQHPEYIFEES